MYLGGACIFFEWWFCWEYMCPRVGIAGSYVTYRIISASGFTMQWFNVCIGYTSFKVITKSRKHFKVRWRGLLMLFMVKGASFFDGWPQEILGNIQTTGIVKQLCCSAAQLYPTLCNPMQCSPPGPSVCGILQARRLEWVARPSSRGSSQPRDQTRVSCIGRWVPKTLDCQGSSATQVLTEESVCRGQFWLQASNPEVMILTLWVMT